MPNPTGKGLKPNKPGERRGGRQAGTRDLRTLVREAAEAIGFIERVPVLDAEGKPTGRIELRYGKDGEAGYLRWLAANHPGYFAALYGKLLRLEVNQKTEEKTVVHYETVEERRQAASPCPSSSSRMSRRNFGSIASSNAANGRLAGADAECARRIRKLGKGGGDPQNGQQQRSHRPASWRA
jgi:hypothetical protein